MLFSTRRFLLIVVLAVGLGAAFVLSRFWESDSSLADSLTYSLIDQVQYEPSFPVQRSPVEDAGLLVVSKGKVEFFDVKDSQTGEQIGEATILRTAVKGLEDETASLSFIVQFVPTRSERNIIPWLIEKAGSLQSLRIEADVPLGISEITEIFPRGSIWLFIPLVDTTQEHLSVIPEYISYARRYYGLEIARDFRDYLNSGLSGRYNRPVLGLDVIYRGGNVLD